MSNEAIDKVAANPNGASLEDLNSALAALDQENQDGNDETDPKEPVVEVAPAAVEGDKRSDPPADTAKDQVTDDKTATGILAKDGKNVLPYGALVAERDRARLAESTAKQLQESNADLMRQIAELSKQAPAKAGKLPAGMSEEQLADLRDEAPELAAAFESLQAQIAESETAIKTANETAAKAMQRLETTERAAQQKILDDAIAAVPKLAYAQQISQDNPEIWDAIAEIDMGLREMSLYKNLPMAKRFEKAVQLYEAEVGEILVPGSPAKSEPSNPVAKAALAKVTSVVPSTLSDLSGGALPPKSQVEILAGQNQNQLIDQFRDMSTEKLNQLLNSLPV